jgi:putative ferrous iron transport protein C
MILQDIKKYVQQRKQVSLQDIALHFDKEPETIRGMLDFWIRKGRIQRFVQQPSCSSSGSCQCSAKQELDIYQWNPQLLDISIHTQRN